MTKVSEIMNKAVVIDGGISLQEAAKIMSSKGISSLIITEEDKINGIITDTDVLRNVSNLKEKVGKIMSTKVISISQEESVENDVKLIIKNKIKRLPVLDGEKLVGAINLTDILTHVDGDEDGEFLVE